MASIKKSLNYQDYLSGISRLTVDEQLNLLDVIAANLRHSVGANRELQSILELEGLGEEIWRDVDVEAYVQRERASWD